MVADKSHSGAGRGFHGVTRDGLLWRRVVIDPMALN
jgi:hypothetical protein